MERSPDVQPLSRLFRQSFQEIFDSLILHPSHLSGSQVNPRAGEEALYSEEITYEALDDDRGDLRRKVSPHLHSTGRFMLGAFSCRRS